MPMSFSGLILKPEYFEYSFLESFVNRKIQFIFKILLSVVLGKFEKLEKNIKMR